MKTIPPFSIDRFWRMVVLALAVMLAGPGPGLAQGQDNLTEAMIRANENYQTGQFERAIEDYEALVANGVRHAAVYFNLGNAYLQDGEVGRAILNYRRAQLLAPRDEAIAANLEIARAQTVDKIQISGAEQFDLTQLIGQWVTLGEMALLILAMWLLICICAGLYILLPVYRRWLGWLMVGWAAFLIIELMLVGLHLYYTQRYPAAVVVAAEVALTAGPGPAEEFSVNFTLHAGAEVNVIGRQLGWRLITLPGELQGWVPLNTIEMVVAEGG
jgi:tetratricopeptide (TPR) repeat protein